jgi:hypothetical protein
MYVGLFWLNKQKKIKLQKIQKSLLQKVHISRDLLKSAREQTGLLLIRGFVSSICVGVELRDYTSAGIVMMIILEQNSCKLEME